jgi:glycosyltransferase involved in cell wall biosynthesis
VIVLDDASSDGTEGILRGYTDPRIEYVHLARNSGAAAAINHAFNMVQGEYVARIDYDDRYHAHWLVESLAALDANPDAAFVCAAVRHIDPDGRPSAVSSPADYGEEPGCRDRFRSMLTHHFVTAPTILGRTHHWMRAFPIPKAMDFCDWYMNLTMAEMAPVVVLDRVMADYRIHPLNMHTTKVKSGMGERITFEVLLRFLRETPRAAELAPHARRITALHYADWGNKYFGAEMNADAQRCYRAALALDPTLAWKGRFLHRLAGLLAGRRTYEVTKRLARRIVP